MRTALIGSTGLVGKAILKQIEAKPFSSANIDAFSPKDFDVALLATPADVSKKLAPTISQECFVIDSSSAFRMDRDVPLIIPEINKELITPQTRLIASPNCVATILLMALFPLDQAFGARRLIGSTYQAASGGGKKLTEKLFADTKEALTTKSPTDFGLNLFLHEDYVGEEEKARQETCKILGKELPISLTAVRVPTLSSHAMSLYIEFEKEPLLSEAIEVLKTMPGLVWSEKPLSPKEASGKAPVFCSRVRKDPHNPHALELWVVGDQLLKGSALNVIQILDQLQSQSSFA